MRTERKITCTVHLVDFDWPGISVVRQGPHQAQMHLVAIGNLDNKLARPLLHGN